MKLRASQINGCAFCIQFHFNVARQLDFARPKLDLVVAWREAGIYSPREAAALAWTEALTAITPAGIDDAAYKRRWRTSRRRSFALLSAAIGAVNVSNRLAVAFRFTPPIPQVASAAA